MWDKVERRRRSSFSNNVAHLMIASLLFVHGLVFFMDTDSSLRFTQFLEMWASNEEWAVVFFVVSSITYLGVVLHSNFLRKSALFLTTVFSTGSTLASFITDPIVPFGHTMLVVAIASAALFYRETQISERRL